MKKSGYSSLQQRIWRWHFFAGLAVIPFAILLSLTGAIYLFKPQIDTFIENDIHSNTKQKKTITPLAADDLVAIAQSHYVSSTFKRFILAKENDLSVEVELLVNGIHQKVWVNQFTGNILHHVEKDQQFLEVIKNLHGELLTGEYGSYIVELMASWMIILIITGFFIWWPRNKKSIVSILVSLLVPKISKINSRTTWMKLHGVIGTWIGLIILLLLFSGLPWTQVWGGSFKYIQTLMGWNGPGQEWVVTLQSKNTPSSKKVPVSLEEIVKKTQPLHLPTPIEIQPPSDKNGVWTVRSMTQNRPNRVTIHYDKWNGEKIMQTDFLDYHPVKRLTSYGVALHEGALFGWLNQLLGLIAAIGVLVLSITGLVIWWHRKPQGELGAPHIPDDEHLTNKIIIVVIALAIFLPMVAISLATILVIEFFWLLFLKQRNHSST